MNLNLCLVLNWLSHIQYKVNAQENMGKDEYTTTGKHIASGFYSIQPLKLDDII